jgi:alcohol dehydrogenase
MGGCRARVRDRSRKAETRCGSVYESPVPKAGAREFLTEVTTSTVNSTDGKAQETVLKMTGGRGVDTAIEAVGIPATFELCEQIVAPGGTIANIGVHGHPAALHLERLWDRNIAITTRLVDTVSTPVLLNILRSGKIDPKLLITHRFKLDRILDAYETFGHAASTKALKVIIEA